MKKEKIDEWAEDAVKEIKAKKKKKEYKVNPLLTPIAIVIAGAIIGGAIIYNGKVGTSAAVSAASNAATTTSTTNQTVTISLAGVRSEGSKNANVGFIEFSDFQCPYCQQLYQQTIPSLRTSYVKTNKVLHGFFDFPLTQIHQYAMIGAEAARCAQEQNKFWAMHDLIYSGTQDSNDQTQLAKYAQQLNLNMDQYNSCVSTNKYGNDITANQNEGNQIGVTGTPTVIVGKINHKNNTLTGQLISGAQPYSVFQTAINQYLSS